MNETKSKRYNIRMQPSFLVRIKAVSKSLGMSMAGWITLRLTEALRRDEAAIKRSSNG